MTDVVVDASVAIKWFVPEIHSIAAARLLEPAFTLLAPDLIGPEVANTLWKKSQRGEITPQEAAEILAAFDAAGIDVHPSRELLAAALELASALQRSAYDCIYLALAVARDCRLVTADRKFFAIVEGSVFRDHIRWVDDES